MGYTKTELQPKDRLPASLINAMQDAIIENENEYKTQMQTGSYSGTGKVGESNKNVLTFNFEPKLLFVNSTVAHDPYKLFIGKGELTPYVSDNDVIDVSWSGNTVSWYGANESEQLNVSGRTYNYVVIG